MDERSILLVDDAVDIRYLLRMAFEREGTFRVVGEAGDGRAAVELAERLQPDTVLLDLAMPVMDGMQALPRIHEVSPSSCIVVHSGFRGRDTAAQATTLGARGYIEKGTNLADMIGRVKKFCGDCVRFTRIPQHGAEKEGAPKAASGAADGADEPRSWFRRLGETRMISLRGSTKPA